MDIKIEEDESFFHITIPKKDQTIEDIQVLVEAMKKKDQETTAEEHEQASGYSADVEKLTHELRERWPDELPFVKKAWKDMKVLVVDDHSTMRRIVSKILVDLKFSDSRIDEAADGKMALNKLKNERFDLIISDWHMPNMTGIDFLKIVKAVPGLKSVPFLMATAEGQKENVLEAVQVGVNNYIVKPFKAAQMEGKLKNILSKS